MRRRDVPLAQGIEVSLSGVILPTPIRTVRYRGARYVLAQDAEEAATDSIKALARGVKGHAWKLMKKAGILPKSKDPELNSSGEGDNKDGFELKYDLQVGNFAGIESHLYIDYLVKSKNAAGEDASWWESSVSWVKKSLKSKEEQKASGTGNYNLNQMVFRFCKGNHAGTTDKSPKVGQLLETIGFLQGAGDLVTVKNARDEGTELAEGEKEADDQVFKAMYQLKSHFEGKKFPGHNKDKNYPGKEATDWGKSDFWEGMLGELAAKGTVAKPLVGQLIKAIKQMEADGALVDTIKRLEKLAKKPPAPKSMEGPGGIREVVKTKLATIINQGPYRINYTAWDKMAIFSDDAGNTILKIAAPMKPYFTFKKSKGGPPVLLEASCKLCGKIFASKQGDEAAAGKLAWTGVILGRGAALGVNPVETEHQVEETWLTNLKMELPKAEKLPDEEAKKTEAPAEGGQELPKEAPAEAPVKVPAKG